MNNEFRKERQRIAREKYRRKRGISPRIRPLAERLIEKRKIDSNGCWIWLGAIHKNGYGSTTNGSRSAKEYVHRLSYKLWKGEIPQGHELDHLCRNRSCFNPDHLEPVTRRINTLRGIGPKKLGQINSGKTHCKSGHPFDEANTRYRPTGGRSCRECAKVLAAKRREEIRNAAD